MTERAVFQKKSMPVEVEAGKIYYWCACGRSATQPFCDGAHKDTGIGPIPYKAEATGKAFFCGCKATKNEPLCDGSHKSLLA
jgi:CDGSH-type Zn-finger protein